MQQTPLKILVSGLTLLEEVLVPNGFQSRITATGASSGGDFASAEFYRENRRLELHFRHSLGLVRYHLDAVSITHKDYIAAVLGRSGRARYPGFSDQPLEAFEHLKQDLIEHGSNFLNGEDDEFLRIISIAAEQKKAKPRLP